MSIKIELTGRTQYTINGKKIYADKKGWYTTETLTAEERKVWVNHFSNLKTTTKNSK